jgi:hypothetical protein
MNTQIIGYRISYLVFSIFVSCLIVFTIHKGFQRQDIITIPIFAILLFLIIDFSAKSMYQNKMEKFFVEGFESRLQERFTKESLNEEENNISGKNFETEEDDIINEMNKGMPIMEEEMNKRMPIMEEEMYKRMPIIEEETHNKMPIVQEILRKLPVAEEEETFQKYAPVGEKQTETPSASKPSATPSGDKKAKEATNKQEERPDINKHLMDDGNKGLSNRNTDTLNPININVSYNNNRPFTVNDFNNPDIDKNTQNRMGSGRTTDINSYRFDDGCMNRSVNSGIDSINQKYFPAYLENPLNKNQPKVDNDNNNYEMKMMKRILNEQNDPSPVLLENPWSEWKPLDK